MHHGTSELWNSSERPWKFREIFVNSWIIFGNSGTRQDKKLMPLAQKKLAGIGLECFILQCFGHDALQNVLLQVTAPILVLRISDSIS